jgi:hypothetical protein
MLVDLEANDANALAGRVQTHRSLSSRDGARHYLSCLPCRLRATFIAEHLGLGMSDADEAIAQLVVVLDTKELADAINRLERRSGLRVVTGIRGAD